jgi:hypothetical protein
VSVIPVNQRLTSAKVTVSSAMTGTLSSGTPLPLNLTRSGQPAMLSFSLATPQSVTLAINAISTTPASVSIAAYLFNSAGTQIASGSSATSLSLSAGTLAAGTYSLWLVPARPATTTMIVSY